jgi:uncharacterized protein
MDIASAFPKGLLRPELFMGVISSVSAYKVRVNLSDAGSPSGSHFSGGRYGRGEVGEFVLIEGQVNLLLGRVVEVSLPEQERRAVKPIYSGTPALDAIGNIQLLGSVSMDTMIVQAGVENYPRLGDRVYAAPHKFVSKIPSLMDVKDDDTNPVLLHLGSVDVAQESEVAIKPEKLFGRHCAILGTTGGGKSWTTARIIEECIKHNSKIILLDATSEYREFSGVFVQHCHLGTPLPEKIAVDSLDCSLPPSVFSESDFTALFRPSPGVQSPKFREALISLRMVKCDHSIGNNGFLIKANRQYSEISDILLRPEIAAVAYNPNAPFDITKLIGQIEHECVWENADSYGRKNDQQWGYCSTLVSRIANIINSRHLRFVFKPGGKPSITESISGFIAEGNRRLLRLCLSGVSYEFQSREIVANTIGRYLLNAARDGQLSSPAIIIVDEAHSFLGHNIGSEDVAVRLDAFELIAKEGRKYGLNICLVTQRPRDVTEGVLSQIGTLIVHRLTNDRDREVVERACGEIDRAASSFLPNLKPGEAAILGADFPIPLTIQIDKPSTKPLSDGPDFQKKWKVLNE